MKQLTLAVLATFLTISAVLWAGNVSAVGLDYYGIETVVDKNFLVSTTATLIFDEPINHIDYNLDFPIFNLSVKTFSGTSRCGFENTETGSVISCDFYGIEIEDTTIKLSFSTRNAIKRIEDNYEFRAGYPITVPTKRMFSIIKLPPKGTLAGETANQSYFPSDGNILTDGKHMIISWEKKNLTSSDLLTFSVLFEVGGAGGLLWDMSVIAMTMIVVVVMIAVAVFMRRGSASVQKEVKVLPLLNKDEKKIVDIAARHGGEAKQRELVRESDFSKAKVSRLVKNLKERGVVDTEPISGRENKVILKIKGVE